MRKFKNRKKWVITIKQGFYTKTIIARGRNHDEAFAFAVGIGKMKASQVARATIVLR